MAVKNKIGASIVLAGYQGAGKTPMIKLLQDITGMNNNAVYDIRREYDAEKNTLFYNYELFREFFNKTEKCFFIVEEATAFINAYKEMEMVNQLVGVEHSNKVVVFPFHSYTDIPIYVWKYSTYGILLPTNDDPELVRTQRPVIWNILRETGNAVSSEFGNRILNNNYPVYYSIRNKKIL